MASSLLTLERGELPVISGPAGDGAGNSRLTGSACSGYWPFMSSADRRRIPYCNVTKHPTSLGIIQQLREAFPF